MSRILTVGVVATGLLVLAGCYTLLQHPRVQNEASALYSEGHATEVLPSDDCLQCHDRPHEYYNPTLPYGTYYQGRSRAWLFYYDTPWWAEPYYYGGAIAQRDTTLPRPRQFGRRGRRGDAPAGQSAVSGSAGAAGAPSTAKRAGGQSSDTGSQATGIDDSQKRSGRRDTTASQNSKEKRRQKKKKQ